MMSFVEHWPDEIVHCGIHDNELFRRALLAIQHLREQNACLPDDRSARFDHHGQFVPRHAFPQSPNKVTYHRGLFTGLICDPQAAPKSTRSIGMPSACKSPMRERTLPVASRIGE